MTDTTANARPTERPAGFPCWIELYTRTSTPRPRSTGTSSGGRSTAPKPADR